MTDKVFRKYLEIKSLQDLNEVKNPSQKYSIELVNPKDFHLTKFFYKNIGKSHQWTDRLVWSDLKWMNYISNEKLFTYVLKEKDEIVTCKESKTKNTDLEEPEETTDNSAVKEILDIFPGAIVKK